MHFSKYINLKINGHEDIDFVDVNLKTDTKLFIDPLLIECSNDIFSRHCTIVLNSFFNRVFECCKTNDDNGLQALLDFGHEPNETKLGLSRKQSSGKGASSDILHKIFKQVYEKNLISDGLVKSHKDLSLFIDNFAEDRMSDLITNILRKELYQFTKAQCCKHKIALESKKEIIGSYWDKDTLSWNLLEEYPLKAGNITLMLVPKFFVRQRFAYSVREYLQQKILVERQDYHQANKTSLAKIKQDKFGNMYYEKPSKKAIYEDEVRGTPHKQYVEDYSRKNPNSLLQFRKRMIKKSLLLELCLTNEQLDNIVYKKISKVS
ncbi:hypothetical protein [Anaerosinus massiliensis]|uniref:hypothetical protein n=1 Tax=Massilibacillus massiliensis TaxID=1806837 RepID=UPI000AFC6877|nr:hypothetical protein [Massilibacillus massiliensis]